MECNSWNLYFSVGEGQRENLLIQKFLSIDLSVEGYPSVSIVCSIARFFFCGVGIHWMVKMAAFFCFCFSTTCSIFHKIIIIITTCVYRYDNKKCAR